MHPLAHRTLALTMLTAVACTRGAWDEAPGAAAPNGSLASEIAADAPAAYFSLAETQGTIAHDSSGNGRNGTYVGGVALGQAGALADTANTAALFNGVDGRIDVQDSSSLRLDGNFSIEFFAKSSGAAINRFPGILGKGNAESGTGYVVYYESAQRPVFKRAHIDGCRVSRSAKLSTRAYKHYVLTYDAATRIPRWYVNGRLDTTCALASYPTNTDASPLAIGRGDMYGKTFLDEVALYGSALSATQVQRHFDSRTTIGDAPPTDPSQPALLPDLVVTDVTWSTPAPSVGSEVIFGATIKNQGAGATPAGTVHGVAFRVDGTVISWSDTSTASLAQGESLNVTANSGPTGASAWTATAGVHSVEAWVDDVDRILEVDENDNKLTEALTVADAPPSPPPSNPPTGSGALFGYSAHILSQGDRDAYTAFAQNGGAGTIRDDISWAWIETSKGSFNWAETDALVTYTAKHGLRPLFMVGTSPAWASGHSDSFWYLPNNPADYGDFAKAVAQRYGANGTFWSSNPSIPKVLPAGIEIWNEPNLGVFATGGADPMKYTAMLKDAYTKIKSADPTLTVVAGAIAAAGGYNDADCNGVADGGHRSDGSMNGVNFLEQVYANGAAGYFDAISWHPYNFWTAATASQMLAYHACSMWSQVQDTTPSARSLMVANGDSSKRIWATETGAPTCVAGASYPCVSEAEQANFATQAIAIWKSRSFTGNYYWYDLRDDYGGNATNDMEEHFGAVRADNTLKPSYAALKSAFAQ